MKIITVTLNPSLDRTLTVNHLHLGYHNLATSRTRIDAAGRGMNISAALEALKAKTVAIVLLGANDPASYAYENLLAEKSFPIKIVRCLGAIRSNIFIKDTNNNSETIIKEDGSEFDSALLREVAKTLRELIEPNDFVVFGGALSLNADDDSYARLTEAAKEAGARVVLDTYGPPLARALRQKPDLVIMTQLQFERYYNMPVRGIEDVIGCARKMREEGAGRVLVMLADEKTILLMTEAEELMVELPDDMEYGTYTGTYDAMIAGYLAGRIKQRPFEKSLELGAAAAVYTASQVGNEFGNTEDIKSFLSDIKVLPLE